MTSVKRTYTLRTVARYCALGMFVIAVFAHMDQVMAYTTVITHEDRAVGGCGGQGC